MNRIVPTRWGPGIRFPAQPLLTPPFRATQDNALELLKGRLLQENLAGTTNPRLNILLRRAANEAASLAWSTAYPLLMFPELFEEKSRQIRRQYTKQESILRASARLVA